jgi:hypothetical protein
MATWPASLPQSLQVTGFQESYQNQVLRSEMEAGPPKQRRRFSATTDKVAGQIIVTKAQLSTFNSFWDGDIAGGALAFDWQHPITGNPASMRFVEPFNVRLAQGSNDEYVVELKLEILP